MTDTIHAQALLQSQIWLGAQTRTVVYSRANNQPFDTDGHNFQNVVNMLIQVAGVWELPILRHLCDDLIDVHNKLAAGGIGIRSPLVEHYINLLQKVRDYLPGALMNNSFIVVANETPSLDGFGDVAVKLPAITSDLTEALACANAGRHTATVFHLMRAIEASLRAFGKKLKIDIDADQANWYQITQHINRAIDRLPNRTTAQALRKQSYGVVSAHLNAVRIAWRNEVMHPKASYAREEAADILVHSKALIKSVIKVL